MVLSAIIHTQAELVLQAAHELGPEIRHVVYVFQCKNVISFYVKGYDTRELNHTIQVIRSNNKSENK